MVAAVLDAHPMGKEIVAKKLNVVNSEIWGSTAEIAHFMSCVIPKKEASR